MVFSDSLKGQYLALGFSDESDSKHLIFRKSYSFVDFDNKEKEVTIRVIYNPEFMLVPPILIDVNHVLTSMHSLNGFQCWARFSDIFPQIGLALVPASIVEEQIKKLIQAHVTRVYYTINESPEFAAAFAKRDASEHTRFWLDSAALGKIINFGYGKIISGIAHIIPDSGGYAVTDQEFAKYMPGIDIVLPNKPCGENRRVYFLNVKIVPHFDFQCDEIKFLYLLEGASEIPQDKFYLQNILEEIFIVAVFYNKNLGHHDIVVFRKSGKKLTLLPHARVSTRPVLFSRHWSEAEKLSDKKIALMGIGAIGSVLGMTLLQSGIDHLYIIDHDYVELENTTRSIYTESDIGSLKTDAFKKIASQKDFDLGQRVSTIDNFETFDFQPDLFIICIGDLYKEYELSLLARKANYDKLVFVFGQNDCTWGAIYFQDEPSSGCQHCLFLHQNEDPRLRIPYIPYISEAVGCGNPSYVSTPSDTGLLANLAVKLIVRRLTQEGGNLPNYYIWQSNPQPSAWKDDHIEQFSLKSYRVQKHASCKC